MTGEHGNILVLGGTGEAVELATRLAGRDAAPAVTVSLAGRTRRPADVPARVRTGGFGGIDGLVAELVGAGYDRLVDATHPFAARMPHHAAAAATRTGIPRLRLLRPSWVPGPGDRWHPAVDLPDAARRLEALGSRRVFLATGRFGLAAFSGLDGIDFVVRTIEAPDPADLPRRATVVSARGPFGVEDERDLLGRHGIDTIVSRNSGGTATVAKLHAARALGIRVVMVDRPPAPTGPSAATVDEALAWLDRTFAPDRVI